MKKRAILITGSAMLLSVVAVIFVADRNRNNPETVEEVSPIFTPTVILTESKEIPKDFPADFPVIADATILSSWSTEKDVAKGLSVMWETDRKPAEVYSFYKSGLEALSYTITNSQDEAHILSFEKGNTTGIVGITEGEGGKTTISVTMGMEDVGDD